MNMIALIFVGFLIGFSASTIIIRHFVDTKLPIPVLVGLERWIKQVDYIFDKGFNAGVASIRPEYLELKTIIGDADIRGKTDIIVPFWLWHGLLERADSDPCLNYDDGCINSGDCITEWCIPCAAKAFFKELCHDKLSISDDEEI